MGATGAALTTVAGVQAYAHWDRSQLDDAGLSTEYCPGDVDDYWLQHKAVAVCRLWSIALEVAPYVVRVAWAAFQTSRAGEGNGDDDNEVVASGESAQHEQQERQEAAARDLRLILTRLGPLFIKLGQALSIRPDVLPTPVLRELQKLCDSVPPFATALALRLVEQELARPVGDVFVGLDASSAPVAAASLGQVYCCRLRETGELVAVKVQRPDMLRSVTLDLFLLRRYFRVVEAVKEFLMERFPDLLARRKQFDLQLFDTFARATLRELDYKQEAASQEFFAQEIAKRMAGEVYVPGVRWSATSHKVLCSEWIDGKPLASAGADEIRRLVPVGVECFLMQLLELGRFHSDPHPGNLFVENKVAPDCSSGKRRLVLLDFGLVASLERCVRWACVRTYVRRPSVSTYLSLWWSLSARVPWFVHADVLVLHDARAGAGYHISAVLNVGIKVAVVGQGLCLGMWMDGKCNGQCIAIYCPCEASRASQRTRNTRGALPRFPQPAPPRARTYTTHQHGTGQAVNAANHDGVGAPHARRHTRSSDGWYCLGFSGRGRGLEGP
jgi:hypothetical protein